VGGSGDGSRYVPPPPPEIVRRRFNLGAALGGGAWAIVHGLWDTVVVDTALTAVALAGLAMAIRDPSHPEYPRLAMVAPMLAYRTIMGFRGYRWGWRSGRFPSPEEFLAVQRRWRYLGALVSFVVLSLFAEWHALGSPGLSVVIAIVNAGR
jgi:hypothetical protein